MRDADSALDTAGGTGRKHWEDAASASLEQAIVPSHQGVGSIHLGVCLKTTQLGKDHPCLPDVRIRCDLYGTGKKTDMIYCHNLGCSDQV